MPSIGELADKAMFGTLDVIAEYERDQIIVEVPCQLIAYIALAVRDRRS